ncbi:MAG: damage-inducible protein DinB [Candidatus Hydrogenedentes bacterium]|nr:damage-inducible protein DinB [Candidatus Hydrogenedentota bacterium]
MNMIEPFLIEYTHECAQTRRTIERVPEGVFGWQPHQKSFTIGKLASHLAENPIWARITLEQDVLELPGSYVPFVAKTHEELMGAFDQNVRDATAILKNATNELLMSNWTMKMDGRIVLEMPRMAVLKTFVLNHTIHHRGQLTVYLRLLDLPVPALYGPSADEQG